jgi:carbonic anhydrase
MNQSPIQLIADEALGLKSPAQLFTIDYPQQGQKCSGHFEMKNGHPNFVFDYPVKGAFPKVTFRGQAYRLAKIHLHEGIEHHFAEHGDLTHEVHLIHIPEHSAVPSPLVVIGILYRPTEGTGGCTGVRQLCGKSKSKTATSVLVDPLDFFPLVKQIPETKRWYHYEGSLTGYPYSEIVSWFVMEKPGNITLEEIGLFDTHATQHSRELQPLNRRLVVRSF